MRDGDKKADSYTKCNEVEKQIKRKWDHEAEDD